MYQFLETGTSGKTFMGRDQELKWLAFSLYPLSFFLYSPFKPMLFGSLASQRTNINIWIKITHFPAIFSNLTILPIDVFMIDFLLYIFDFYMSSPKQTLFVILLFCFALINEVCIEMENILKNLVNAFTREKWRKFSDYFLSFSLHVIIPLDNVLVLRSHLV